MSSLPSFVPRTDFGAPPPGYVAGLGRGAVGFTTRSDIGPAQQAAEPSTAGSGRGRRATAAAKGAPPGFPGNQPKAGDYSDSKFDAFSGFGEQLFSVGTYDEDDKEADAIYQAIDDRMDSKRRIRREATLKEEMRKYRKKRPKIAEQFRDLKKGLASVSAEDWEALPEPMDHTRRNKRVSKRADQYTPLPDNVVDVSRLGGGMGANHAVLDARQQMYGGLATPVGGFATPMVGGADVTQLGRARDKVLSLKLDRMADSVSGQTVVDPKGYLTDLNSLKVNSEAEVSDIKKARLLLKSVITTNPKHAPGWIAAARLEAETGKVVKARQLIMQGCKTCPKNEDVWLEAARLHSPQNAKSILAQAVRHVPTSVKVWLKARDLEEDMDAKKTVLRRALDLVPTSVRLWKAAVEQETPEDARVLLGRAVECVPHSVEMWLALAKLETYKNAQKVLNRARKKNPTDPSIWITAAKLEEANGNEERVDRVIKGAIKSLTAHSVVIDRDTWLNEAELAEQGGAVITCQAIVKNTIGMNVEEQDRRNTWLSDADLFLGRGSIETARAVYAHMLTEFRGKESIWRRAADLEKEHGTPESLEAVLREAVKYCPQSESMWLRLAKEKSLAGDVAAARQVMQASFDANPESEEIWLAAVKLESENKEYERAKKLLANARQKSNTAHVWMKSALLERHLGNPEMERELLNQALNLHPDYPKLWMMMGQWHVRRGNFDQARKVYKEAVKLCPNSVPVWLCYVELEVLHVKSFSRARSLLETARLRNPNEPLLWLASVRVEQRAGNTQVAQQVLARAMQECNSSGILWAHAVASDARPQRKSRSYDALKKCKDDPHVFLAVARLFWTDRKVKKARDWFKRAVAVDSDLGDTWVYYLKFELQHGTPKQQEDVVKKCLMANPKHGELWVKLSKGDYMDTGQEADVLVRKGAELIKEHFPLNYDHITVKWVKKQDRMED